MRSGVKVHIKHTTFVEVFLRRHAIRHSAVVGGGRGDGGRHFCRRSAPSGGKVSILPCLRYLWIMDKSVCFLFVIKVKVKHPGMYVYDTYYAPICHANGMEKASFARIVGAGI